MSKLIAENRRARFDYHIEDTLEVGVVLAGSEVKSLRAGKCNIAESYASVEEGELFLINSYIPEYSPAAQFNHEPRRRRKLLCKQRELNRLRGAVEREGRTLAPLRLYFNERGLAKLELALAVGKKAADKREAKKEQDWKRQQARLLRDKG
ncbi:MAG: SsrA-binding protein SmpB [Hyphomonadaceae bacterium]|nr:SsrA-binding protein SmpB [Hyphomonadaceae bacterium]